MKTIIYYRKSTDRDDKQANSLEHQLENCLRVSEKYNLEVIKQIGESRSAKTEFTRPGFNELIDICKKGKVDFIIIDEPKRLSRNNIDTSRIIDLLDKKLIKGILGSSREYRSDNSRDKFLLQLDLSLSKMDNEDRSKDVKDKMETCINNTGRFLGKAPFGYKNITIKKGHKEIEIDKNDSKIVKEIFDLRIQNKAFSTIALIIREKYGDNIGISLSASRMQKIVSKKFYYGVFNWNGKDIVGSHKPLISKETFDKANIIGVGVYERTGTILNIPREYRKYHFKGFVKDNSGILMCSYLQKGHTYYMTQPRSEEKVNINEQKIFDKFGELLKDIKVDNQMLLDIQKDMIIELLKQDEEKYLLDKIDYNLEIKKIEKKQEDLLDMKLDGIVSEELYLSKFNKFESEILDLKTKNKEEKKDDFLAKTQILFELLKSPYISYKRVIDETKTLIIKNYVFELFIDNKKDLHIAETPLFKGLKYLNFSFGTLKKIILELL
ncbi:MAG: recombinase family protein [Candidatus Gracilibacteria bacterium]|nr:recombinase family protein [Candidatus Gracilibacteria bacterium]